MTSSSKTIQRLQSLMARYDKPEARRQAEHRPSRPAPKPAPKVTQLVRPAQIDREIKQAIRSKVAEKSSEPRLPRELIWDTFEGVKVLVSEIPNYVAERTPNGSYSVIQLNPRFVIARGLHLKDVMPTIRRHHERLIEQQIREADRLRQSSEAQKEAEYYFENSPGFYIVPGETVGPDDVVYNATGPYWRFERINRGEPPEDDSQVTDDDVENDARETSRRLSLENNSTPVIIIEAHNAREAAQGKGHVWWVEDALKGPPVDPRQTGFNW